MTWKKGEAPWETGQIGSTFAAPGFRQGEAPWETGGGAGPSPHEPLDMSKAALEEMHPAISWADRAIVKNFANSPEAGVKYLQDKYPNLQITHDGERYIIGAPGDEYNRVLDPQTGVFSKDLPQDLTDAAYDTAAGFANTGAATLGAGAGLLAAGPTGSLAGGALAAGATGAGTEYARQKIGQELGIPQEINGKQVAMSGVINGVTQGLMGTNPLKSAVEKYSADQLTKGLTPEAVQALIDKSGQGLLKRGYLFASRTVAPKVASMASGASTGAIKTLGNRFDELQGLSDSGITDTVENAQSRLINTIAQKKAEVGAKLGDAINNSGKQVDISKVKDIYKSYINDLESYKGDLNTPAINAEIDAAKQEYGRLFSNVDAGPISSAGSYTVPGTQAVKTSTPMREVQIDQATQIPYSVDKTSVNVEPNIPSSNVPIVDNPRLVTDPQTGMPVEMSSEVPNQISARSAFKLQDDLRDLAQLQRLPGGVQSRFANNATAAEKNFAEKSRGAYNEINQGLDQATEGLSPELKSQYKEYSDLQKYLQPAFRTPEATFKTLTNLDSNQKRLLYERLQALSKSDGIDLSKDAHLLEAYKYFGKPSDMAISSGGTTSTSRTAPLATVLGTLGGLAGYKMGGGYAGAAGGALAGTYLGNTVGSPAAIKNYVKGGRILENLGGQVMTPINKYAPALPANAMKSLWMMLNNRTEGTSATDQGQ